MTESLIYVITAPYFWQTMAMTSASSIWIGALLYNGDLRMLVKGLVTLVPYVSLLVATNVLRISNNPINDEKLAYAGIITILFLTIFYIKGLIFGVLITKYAHKK